MQRINTFSDAHEEPDGISDELRQIIGIAKEEDAWLGSVGDLFNLLPHGLRAYLGSKTIKEFKQEVSGLRVFLCGGNHDPVPWLKGLFYDCPNIVVERNRTIYHSPMKCDLHFRHGHGWSPDWYFLRHFAPSLVEFMADHCPEPWYWFSREMGWIPSAVKQEKSEQDYHLVVMSVWYKAVKYARRHNVRVINGHTHAVGGLETWVDGETDVIFADGGSLRDGSYLRITDQIEFRRLL